MDSTVELRLLQLLPKSEALNINFLMPIPKVVVGYEETYSAAG